jgi:polysaccharide biosynthesis protein PslH
MMRILMLSGAYPLPAINGATRRILAIASHLSQRHDLTLVSLREHESPAVRMAETACEVPWQDHVVGFPVKSRWRTAIRSCVSKYSYGQVKYWNREYLSVTEKLLATQSFDCIWVHVLNMAPYIEHCFRGDQSWQNRSQPVFVLDQQNVDELYYRSFVTSKANAAWRMYAVLEMLKAKHLQKQWFPRFDAILCVSREDLQKTARYVDAHTRLWLAPNGVSIDYFQPISPRDRAERTRTLVFGASLDVAMNQDAVHWFAVSILPRIKQEVPDVQFWIVGRDPPATVRSLAEREGITVTGTVPDVRDYYRQAAVFVVPLRAGGGTKLKTLEAMAMGLPIVSTAVGAQGLEVESGQHLYIADNPEIFATYVVELLKERNKAIQMGGEARRLVEQRYSWTSIVDEVDRKLTDYVQKRAS